MCIGHAVLMGEMTYTTNNILIVKLEGKMPLAGPKCVRTDGSEIDLEFLGYDNVDWIEPAQDRVQCRILLNKVMEFQVP
jgi:hypothetical protein